MSEHDCQTWFGWIQDSTVRGGFHINEKLRQNAMFGSMSKVPTVFSHEL